MSPFARLLKTYRERAGLAQMHLALLVSADHSYVSRLESGTRSPSRGMALALAAALNLSDAERDGFLAAAGFASEEMLAAAADPDLIAAGAVLLDERVPEWWRDWLRRQLREAVAVARDVRIAKAA